MTHPQLRARTAQPKMGLDTVHPDTIHPDPWGTVMTGNNRNLLIDGDFQAVDLTSGDSGVFTDTVVGNFTRTGPLRHRAA
jgi:hypothetical protein